MQRLHRVYYIFFILQTLAWTSCQTENRSSIIVVAVDRLPADQVLCSEESVENSGLKILCKEAVRFTHAYTSSLQPAAAIASVLTGVYPLDHELYRSFDRLVPSKELISKVAKENNYVTSFFSGSPFVLKKTGLSEYFDLFDDSVATVPGDYVQDFSRQTELMVQWAEALNKPFFSVIYNAELIKLSEKETNQNGFEKFDEKLFTFFNELKKRKLWDNSYVVVVGLNGSNRYNRVDSSDFTNLHSENTNVALMIKSPRAKGDEGVRWKNDYAVSLADLGQTLHCIVSKCNYANGGARPFNQPNKLFPVFNLSELLIDKKSEVRPKNDFTERALITQTTNTFLTNPRIHRFSVLHKNYNFIEQKDNPNRYDVYNNLTDKSETNNLNKSSVELWAQSSDYLNYLAAVRATAGDAGLAGIKKLVDENYLFWRNVHAREFNSRFIPGRTNPLTYFFLAGQTYKKSDKATKQKVLELTSQIRENEACLNLLATTISKDDIKVCTDPFFMQYLFYIKADQLGVPAEKNKFLYDLMKVSYKENIFRLSVNLAFENSWGLYDADKSVIHPLVFVDRTFFDN